MTDPELERRRKYARSIRAVRHLDTAAQLLEAYDNESATDLDAIESLPDWTHGTLLAHALEPTPPRSLTNAADLKALREMQLIGTLARACEQALHIGDIKTANAMAKLCNGVLLQTRGVASLVVALAIPEVEA
jgi:hypothetical protein